MNFNKLSPEVINDKIIVIRVDFNVPIKNSEIEDITRIEETIPTIKYLLENNAKRIHILTHIGRPEEKFSLELSTQQLIPILNKLLDETVEFRSDFTSGYGKIQLHENTRFFKGETTKDALFVQEINSGLTPDIFINDAFATAHRKHASVVGLAKFVPSYPGLLLQKEIETLSPFLDESKIEGLSVIISGKKLETKIPVLEHFAKISDHILLGGCVATTFMVAQGYEVGKSIYDENFVKNARRILKIANQNQTGVHSPLDVVCADNIDSNEAIVTENETVLVNMGIFDVGTRTIQSYIEILEHSKIIIWNGPLGVIENPIFEKSTKRMIEYLRDNKKAKIILGGGDTIKALKKWNISKKDFYHVSTGGGAMLEFIEGKPLPGIEILLKN